MPANPGLVDLANIVAQVDSQGAPENEEVTPLPPVREGTPPPEEPTVPEDDDQTQLPEEQQPPAPGDAEEATPGSATDDALSHTDSAELNEALKGLNNDARKHLIEMAREVAEGNTSIGQLKRGHKIAEDFRAEIEEMRQQLEQFKANPTATAPTAAPSNGLLPEIAKLKTMEEVETHAEKAKAAVRFLEDFLDDNPNGGEIHGKTYSRQEIKERKRGWQDELDQLPRQAQRLQFQQQAQVRRSDARAELEKDYPWVAQADHAETKAIQKILRENPWMQSFDSPEYVAAIHHRGMKSLQEELAQRKGAKPPPARPVPGKVPTGKPHVTAPAAGGSRRPGDASANSALKGVMEKRDRNSLATLVSVTGR